LAKNLTHDRQKETTRNRFLMCRLHVGGLLSRMKSVINGLPPIIREMSMWMNLRRVLVGNRNVQILML